MAPPALAATPATRPAAAPELAAPAPRESEPDRKWAAGWLNRFEPGGQVFFRPDVLANREDYDWRKDDIAIDFTLRADVGLGVRLPAGVRAFVNLQSYGVYHRRMGPLDETVRLYEGYLEMKQIGGTPFEVKIGRQSLGKYGTELMIGDRDWENGLPFEAIRGRWAGKHLTSDVFWIQLYQENKKENRDPKEPFFNPVGLVSYNTLRISPALGIDGYFIALLARRVGIFNTDTLTAGGRVFGEATGFDYSAELAYQFGPATIDGGSQKAHVQAYAVEGTVGYTLPGTPRKPRLGLSYYRASGDGNPTDDKIQTFNAPWQNQHSRFGGIDLFRGTNVVAATGTASFRPRADLTLRADFIAARALEAADPAVQFLGSGAAPKATARRTLGAGGGVLLGYDYSPQLDLLVYFGLFQPGAYGADNAGLRGADILLRAYVLSRVRF